MGIAMGVIMRSACTSEFTMPLLPFAAVVLKKILPLRLVFSFGGNLSSSKIKGENPKCCMFNAKTHLTLCLVWPFEIGLQLLRGRDNHSWYNL